MDAFRVEHWVKAGRIGTCAKAEYARHGPRMTWASGALAWRPSIAAGDRNRSDKMQRAWRKDGLTFEKTSVRVSSRSAVISTILPETGLPGTVLTLAAEYSSRRCRRTFSNGAVGKKAVAVGTRRNCRAVVRILLSLATLLVKRSVYRSR